MDNKQAYDLLVDYIKFLIKRNMDCDIRFSPEQKEFMKASIDIYCEELKRKNKNL